MADAAVSQKIVWAPVESADAYEVVLRDAANAVLKTVDVVESRIRIADLCAGLPLDVDYKVRVAAKNAFGKSAYSAALVFTLRTLEAPGVPEVR